MDEAPVADLGPDLTSAVFMGNRFRYGETIDQRVHRPGAATGECDGIS